MYIGKRNKVFITIEDLLITAGSVLNNILQFSSTIRRKVFGAAIGTKFDIYFHGFFGFHCKILVSERETGLWAMYLLKFEIFPIFIVFCKIFCKSYVIRQLVRQLIYQVFYTKYQILFDLWRLRPVLKHSKVPKYNEQDCLKIHFALKTCNDDSAFCKKCSLSSKNCFYQ